MGESITEGTITKWLKKPGDTIQRDEPLFEISTDKVDAEIPSPSAGTLKEIKIAEGTTVQINTVVATIDEAGSASAAPAPASSPAKAETAAAPAADSATPAAVDTPAVMQGNAPTTGGPGTEVLMPQMGESITEGTITKWLKKVGDTVQRDEPIFEISTDKVDAEIPSPVAGVLSEIKVPEGSTVTINTVVAVIGGAAGRSAVPAAAPPSAPAPADGRRTRPLFAARAQDCEGKQHRPDQRSRYRSLRSHYQDGYCQSSGASPEASRRCCCPASLSSRFRTCRREACCTTAAARRARPDVEDARHHRATHGRVKAHEPACPHRLQGGYDTNRQDPR